MAICTKYIMAIQIFELHWKMHAARIKLRGHCIRPYQMEQIDIKSSARSLCGVEKALEEKKERKKDKMQFLATSGSICKDTLLGCR